MPKNGAICVDSKAKVWGHVSTFLGHTSRWEKGCWNPKANTRNSIENGIDANFYLEKGTGNVRRNGPEARH
jgi:hypothetical protein